MKHAFLFVVIFQIIVHSMSAQECEFRINPSANLTHIPDFNNLILIANDGITIPGIIDPSNSTSALLISESQSKTNVKPGFSFDIEFGVRLNDKWQLSFSTGLTQFRFDYDTYVDSEGTQSVYLSNLSRDYGYTNLLYINLKPANISSKVFNSRFTILFGPTFNFLVKSNYSNALVLYTSMQINEQTVELVDKIYFESIEEMNKILYGIHFRTAYNITRRLDVFVSGQYYFNSIYHVENYGYQKLSDCKPLQFQAGVSYALWNSEKKLVKKTKPGI